MTKHFIKRWTGLITLLVAAIALCGIESRSNLEIRPIASAGGRELELINPAEKIYYLQADPRWGGDLIGGSDEPLALVGCTLCSVAMASGSLGYLIAPGELNKRLIQVNGYTQRGWLKWEKIKTVSGGKVDVREPDSLSHLEIDNALEAGELPVVKYFINKNIPHWVLIVGKSGKEYLVKDPLNSNKKIVALSEKTKEIVSVRYVMREE